MKKPGPLFSILLLSLISCSPTTKNGSEARLFESEAFKKYWYTGKAEINSYTLWQSRYGEMREGKAVLIFVTEDFSKRKQVKLDDPANAGNDKVGVLKMNFTKNFVTGIYPYSLMLSVFTPVDRKQYPNTTKVTMSSQEWCGQVFSQLNLTNKKYSFQSHSYFEKEGEENKALKAVRLEDELWNLVRLDPENLPEGEIELIPGMFFSRLLHTDCTIEKASMKKEKVAADWRYTITLPAQNRSLSIQFQQAFPHKILGWEETFQERGKPVQTKAILDKTIVTDYWTKNKNQFLYLRDSLGLSRKNY